MINAIDALKLAQQANKLSVQRRIPPLVLWYYTRAIQRAAKAQNTSTWFPWDMADNVKAYFENKGYYVRISRSYEYSGTFVSWEKPSEVKE